MIALSFCGYFCLGLVLILLGANQADIARNLDLDLERTGMLASAFAAGMFVGMAGAGPLYDRLPQRPLFLSTILLTALALFGFGPDNSYPEALLLFAAIGFGSGAYDTLFNAAIAERYAERSARPMTLLHAGTAFGAIAAPMLVAEIAARWHWERSFHTVGAAHLALAAAAVFVPLPTRMPRTRASRPAATGLFSWAIVPFVLVAFAYLGLEAAFDVFAIPYATEGLALDVIRGQTAISSLWFGLLAGRLGTFVLRGNLDVRNPLLRGHRARHDGRLEPERDPLLLRRLRVGTGLSADPRARGPALSTLAWLRDRPRRRGRITRMHAGSVAHGRPG